MALDPHASFILDIYLGADDSGPLVYSLPFELPIGSVNAEPGDNGYGSVVSDIFEGPNHSTLDFSWSDPGRARGDTLIDINFSHGPRILTWSTVPGPGDVGGGDTVAVQAEVMFYGDGLSETVTAQFWDNEAAGGSLVGTPGVLSDPESDGIWKGVVTAVAGADKLRLTAGDSEGEVISEIVFAVP